MSALIYKAGEQADYDPYDFVMSTDHVDRVGDIVEQDWDLRAFRKNPIALWAHQSDAPIGTWEKVAVRENRLIGRINLAEKGTSDLIDTLRSLIEQRILKAVSVGFLPREMEPLDEDDPWGGYRLANNELMECSLCSIPANPHAISLAKSLDPALRQKFFDRRDDPAFQAVAAQIGLVSPSQAEKTALAKSGDHPPQLLRAKSAILRANRTIRMK